MKAIVVYDSKYGNTKIVAEKIVEGISEAGEVDATLNRISEVDIKKIPDYDIILVGSPNHMGGPTRSVKKFIDGLKKLEMKEKYIAIFDTYMGGDFEKAVKKMKSRIKEKVPGSKPEILELSIKVQGMKGPIEVDELPKCKEFGHNIVNLMSK
ncbi:MAG: FprA family A-type flavoprotein [Thermoplasmatales archaeon]|nr:MAG: FprA family A-type flavoprotein [Thermoplasmatales archaeon]